MRRRFVKGRQNIADTMNQTGDTQRRAGRPRDPRVDHAVLNAALELLAEVGYAQVTVDRVAARAGVGKASLYRRWPDKVAMILEAVSRNPSRPSPPDTGSYREDMLQHLRNLVRYRTIHSEAISAIGGEASRNAQFGEAFRESMTKPVLAGMCTIVERAIVRGELPPTTDVALLASLAPSLLWMQRLMTGDQPDETFAERIVAQFFSPDSPNTESESL